MTKYNHTAPAPIIASQFRQSRQASLPALKARHRLHPVSKPDPCCKTPQQQHLPETIPGLGTTIYKLRGRTRDKKQNTMSCGDKTLVLWSAQRSVSLPPRITPHPRQYERGSARQGLGAPRALALPLARVPMATGERKKQNTPKTSAVLVSSSHLHQLGCPTLPGQNTLNQWKGKGQDRPVRSASQKNLIIIRLEQK